MRGVRDRWFVGTLLVAYVAVLAILVTRPWGWELNRLTVRIWTFFRFDLPVVPDSVSPEDYGVLLNVLLFVPFGAMIAALTGWSWWRVTLMCLLTSTAIELAQRSWLVRDASVADVVANTLGGLVGAVVVSVLTRDRGPTARGAGRARRP